MDAHRAAFEYDWRNRFHVPLSVVGRSMSWGEAFRLTKILADDPSSRIMAAIRGWDYPIEVVDVTLRQHLDLMHHIAWKFSGGKGQAPPPYPRPWPIEDVKRTTTRPDASLTQEDIIAALRMAGHTAVLPSPN